jgi:hypothetical protein
MAVEKTININVETSQAEKALNKFGKSIESLREEEFEPLNFAIGELEDRLYEMAAAGMQGTSEFSELASEIGRMKKVIIDTDLVVDGMSQNFAQNMAGATVGVASGFELAQGAMAAFGVEGEQLEETLLKVQSAMAMAQGLQGLKEGAASFRGLGMSAKVAFNNMSKGAKIFAATGIGALLTGVGLLIANFDKLKAMFSTVSAGQEALNATMDDYKAGAKEAVTQTNKVKNAFQLAKDGVISKEEALRTYNTELGDSFGKAKDLNSAEKLFVEKTDAYIEAASLRAQANALMEKAAEEQVTALTAEMEDQTSTIDKATSGLLAYFGFVEQGAKSIENAQKKGVKATKKNAEERTKTFTDEAQKILKQAEKIEDKYKIVSDSEKGINDAAAERAKQRAAELLALRQEQAAQLNELLDTIAQVEEEHLTSQKDRELNAVRDKYFELITKAEEHGLDTSILKEAQEKELFNIEEKYRKETQDAIDAANAERLQEEEDLTELIYQAGLSAQEKELSDLNDYYFEKITKAEQYGLDVTALEEEKAKKIKEINDKYKEEEFAKEQELQLKKVQMTMDAIGAIGDLVTAFTGESEEAQRRAFAVSKAVNLAQAVGNTALAITAALTAGGNPAKLATGAQFVEAGIAAAAGAAQIATIARTKFQGGGGSGAGGGGSFSGGGIGGGATSRPAEFNVVGNTGNNQLAQTLGSGTMKAYVVGADVTTQQSLDRNKIDTATL